MSKGRFNGKEAYATTYKDAKFFMTIGNITSEVRSGSKLGSKIIESQFHDDGIILKWDNGKIYFSFKSGGGEFRGS